MLTTAPLILAGTVLSASLQAQLTERLQKPVRSTPVASSISWGDFDADGFADALVLEPTGGVRLLRNAGDGHFEDVTATAGLDVTAPVQIALWADYDGDRRLDLFLGAGAAESQLLRQTEGGAFENATEAAGLPAGAGPLDARWFDYDLDGKPDLHLVTRTDERLFHNTGGLFEELELDVTPRIVDPSFVLFDVERSSEPGTADRGRAGRDGGGDGAAPSMPPGTVGALNITPACTEGVEDASGGSCIGASSTPSLGRLYPVSTDWFVDSSTGFVGLGTTGPAARLHVEGDSYTSGDARATGNVLTQFGSSADPSYRFGDGSESAGLSSPSFETVAISTNGSEHLRVNSVGRVGIGTNVPGAKLEVSEASGDIMRGRNGSGLVFQVTSTGRVVTTALQITGGGDLVEGFESPEDCEPGSVVVIDPVNPGRLTLSENAYDGKVAGVVSGAGGVNHGIRMGQDDVLDGDTLVAMTGRVYVKCSAENGPVRPGDLLTSANLEGHAMRATDGERSFGAVIGKAMSSLDSGEGLVLVLVNLQ